jgi:hypothetical protein
MSAPIYGLTPLTANWDFAPAAKNGLATLNGSNVEAPGGKIVFNAGASSWTFSARLSCATGSTNWNAQGLLNTTLPSPGIPVFMPVKLTVNGQDYSKTPAGYYTAVGGKAGKMTASSANVQ